MALQRRFVVAVLLAVLAVAAPRGFQLASPAVTVLTRAHAHNDFEHARPLFDALDRGFMSVEADIRLVDGRLLVAHDEEQLRTDRTLQALYLDPLQARVRANGGRVHARGPEFVLWIDIKTEAEATYAALRSALTPYREMLTVFRPHEVETNAVRVIVSGNRPRATMEQEAVRYAAYDGRLIDLSSGASPRLIPIVSDNWETHFKWRGDGPLPEAERATLRWLVDRAHAQQRQIRFWAIPDGIDGWRACFEAGVDFINTDNLDGLRQFLSQRP